MPHADRRTFGGEQRDGAVGGTGAATATADRRHRLRFAVAVLSAAHKLLIDDLRVVAEDALAKLGAPNA